MIPYTKHLIEEGTLIKQALARLNELAADAILFVVGHQHKLIGSLTDGDVRRGFLRGLNFDSAVEEFIQPNPHYLIKEEYSIEQVIEYRNKNFRIIPVVNRRKEVITILNFRFNKSYLPIDSLIMAGGRGERLRPMTDSIPKPLLKVGDKPIIEHNVDRLASFGIDDIWISIRYLGGKIVDHLGDGTGKNIRIHYVEEEAPLGTLGAINLIKDFTHDVVLVSNSDILTNLDYEEFFIDFINSGCDMSVVTIPYSVKIPYAVLETSNNHIMSFKEKPTYTYYSNGGIYLIRRNVLQYVKDSSFLNATDLMETLLRNGCRVKSFPMVGYWLDIGSPEDFKKAQEDILHLKL